MKTFATNYTNYTNLGFGKGRRVRRLSDALQPLTIYYAHEANLDLGTAEDGLEAEGEGVTVGENNRWDASRHPPTRQGEGWRLVGGSK